MIHSDTQERSALLNGVVNVLEYNLVLYHPRGLPRDWSFGLPMVEMKQIEDAIRELRTKIHGDTPPWTSSGERYQKP